MREADAPQKRMAEATESVRKNDYRAAIANLDPLARLGSLEAMYWLGHLCYRGGHGIARDYAKAHYWFEKAFNAGGFDSFFGRAAAIRLHEIYSGGMGVNVDERRAFMFVSRFEEIENPSLADAPGLFRAAIGYECGMGIQRDRKRAIILYRRAARLGHIWSSIALARRRVMRGNLFAVIPWMISSAHAQAVMLRKGMDKEPRLWL